MENNERITAVTRTMWQDYDHAYANDAFPQLLTVFGMLATVVTVSTRL